MNPKLIIKIKKPSQSEFLIWSIIGLSFLFGTLIEFLKFPSAIKYVCDLSWLGLLLLMLLQRRAPTGTQKILFGVILAYFFYTLVGYIINFQSPLYYLWGFRNNFRMYVFFSAMVMLGKVRTCDGILGFFDRIFWLNVVVCLVQYFALGKHQDYLGGIFGTQSGCNAWLNNYFVIMTTVTLLDYLSKRGSLINCAMKCAAMLIIAAFAELKVYYVEFVVILVMAILLTEFSWKKLLIIFGGLVGVILTTKLLVTLFPIFEGAFTLKGLYEIVSNDKGYTGKGDINRMNFISVVTGNFLRTFPRQLIGLGLGNCDTASYAIFNTPFFVRYSALNYSWFSSSFVFLETGYLGMCFHFGFYILLFFMARKVSKMQPHRKQRCLVTMICSVCCILISIYNSSLRTEAGYMIYFVLALPFVKDFENKQIKDVIAKEVRSE